MRLRLATYNIHKGVTALRGRPRLHELRLALHRLDADIVFLQEVQERNERLARRSGPSRSSPLDVLSSSGYAHRAYGVNAIYPHGHHGNAILSRLPIEHQANHDVSDHMLERRGVLHAIVRPAPGAPPLHLLCTHFGLARRSRERQAGWVAGFIEREIPAGAPVILAGDFNDWQHAVDRRLRRVAGLREVFDEVEPGNWFERFLAWRRPRGLARTFPSIAPWLSLDRIYLRGLRTQGAKVLGGAAWARCSDHSPLVADVELG